jgi:uncharacterized protein (TIGR02271 family)
VTGDERAEVVRHEEELQVGTRVAVVGAVHAEKRVEVEQVGKDFPRDGERAEVERVPARDGDSGEIETLADGSISIPVLEEELVVSKRTVVRERIVIRKETITEQQHVEAELRREYVDVQLEEEGEDARAR